MILKDEHFTNLDVVFRKDENGKSIDVRWKGHRSPIAVVPMNEDNADYRAILKHGVNILPPIVRPTPPTFISKETFLRRLDEAGAIDKAFNTLKIMGTFYVELYYAARQINTGRQEWIDWVRRSGLDPDVILAPEERKR